jgi:hypothetical protein
MQKLLKALPILSFLLLNVFTSRAQNVEAIKIKGETYYGVQSIPGYTVTGLYNYEGKGEPIVKLNPGGTGQFQRHGVPPDNIRWWILADANGNVKTNKGEAGQVHTLLIQYTEDVYQNVGGGRKVLAYPKGDYDMNTLDIRYAENKIYILGERQKAAN